MAKKSADPFHSPKLLLRGARSDIDRLDREWRQFHERCFGIPFEDFDAKTSERVIKFRICPDVPDDLRVLVSNAFNNLRHTLDQTINSASVELGKKNCPTVRADMIPTLKAFQPYGGGDDMLYTLSKLCGPNKHQVVLNMNLNFKFAIDGRAKGWFRFFRGPGTLGRLAWDSEKQELEAARVGAGGDIQCDYMTDIPIFISLGDSEISRGEPATAFLNTLAGKVDGILRGIEAETARLKL
jgi:hypothetical protein